MFKHALNQRDELLFLERLLDEVHRPFFHRVNRHGNVAVTGDENDRQGRFALHQAALQLKPCHATHADVDDQASHFAWIVAAQK